MAQRKLLNEIIKYFRKKMEILTEKLQERLIQFIKWWIKWFAKIRWLVYRGKSSKSKKSQFSRRHFSNIFCLSANKTCNFSELLRDFGLPVKDSRVGQFLSGSGRFVYKNNG